MATIVEQSGPSSAEWIGSITYRSEATRPLSALELQTLVARAKTRNRSVGVTGMLLHDHGRFLQTLEGPAEGLDTIWSVVQRDTRHRAIEVLSHHFVPARLFSGWAMQLCDRDAVHAPLAPRPEVGSPLADHVPEAARLALAIDDAPLNALIADVLAQGWASTVIVAQLLEPAARMLGDAWLADDCSDFDLTIALSRLQIVGHAIHSKTFSDRYGKSRYSILLATAPGETHMLGSSLLCDMFTEAGWHVDVAFPDSDEALAKQVRSQAPDAVDIALSDALPRHHRLAMLRNTIEKSRMALPDDLMVVSVGGRLFAEAAATARSVGADHARTTAAGTAVHLSKIIEQRHRGKSAS